MTTLLIDGDIILYSVAFSMETPIYVCGGGIYINKVKAEAASKRKNLPYKKRVNIGTEQELRAKLRATLKEIFVDCNSKDYKLYLTGKEIPNYRDKIATILPYKGNRVTSIKPFHFKKLRKILIDDYGAVETQGQEADDILAIEQIKAYKNKGHYDSTIICSIDKDLLQIPGQHYHFIKKEIINIEEEQGLKNFCRQILVGDPSDNIPGLSKLLKSIDRTPEANQLSYSHYIAKYEELTVDFTAEQCYNHVLGMYEGYGFGEKEFMEIADLLWLRRYEGQIYSLDKKVGMV